MYIVIAILFFGLLIAVHELGHFTAAKALGVRVNEFAIGMGPAIFKKQKGETLYALRCLPIGGFCAMEGEDEETDDPRGFYNQKAWKRFIILIAGSFMNFLIGFLLILIIYGGATFGVPTVTEFMDDCPYEGAGALQEGDRFYTIDGYRIYFTSNITRFLDRGGDTHDIVVVRDGKKVELNDFTLTRQDYGEEGQGKFGFYFGETESGPWASLKYSWYNALDFVREVWLALSDLVSGAVGIRDLSGPVGIVDMINDVGQESASTKDALINIVYFIAFIAINLAVMNMLPVPGLDGGRVLFLLLNGLLYLVTRRRIPAKFEGYVHLAGLVLLLALMAFVMYSDIAKLVT